MAGKHGQERVMWVWTGTELVNVLGDSEGRLITSPTSSGGIVGVQGLVADGATSTGKPVLTGLVAGDNTVRSVRGDLTNFDGASPGYAVDQRALGFTYNGTGWDRIRSAPGANNTTGTGLLGSAVLGFSGSNYFHAYVEDGNTDAGATVPIGLVVNSRNKLWNGTGWDRERANTTGTAIATGSYTSTQTGSDITMHNARGVMLYLNVSANPGGAETLTLDVQAKDPLSGQYQSVLPNTVLVTAANGTFLQQIYPGAVETLAIAALIVQGVNPGPVFRVRAVHSGSGSWTYSVGYALML